MKWFYGLTSVLLLLFLFQTNVSADEDEFEKNLKKFLQSLNTEQRATFMHMIKERTLDSPKNGKKQETVAVSQKEKRNKQHNDFSTISSHPQPPPPAEETKHGRPPEKCSKCQQFNSHHRPSGREEFRDQRRRPPPKGYEENDRRPPPPKGYEENDRRPPPPKGYKNRGHHHHRRRPPRSEDFESGENHRRNRHHHRRPPPERFDEYLFPKRQEGERKRSFKRDNDNLECEHCHKERRKGDRGFNKEEEEVVEEFLEE